MQSGAECGKWKKWAGKHLQKIWLQPNDWITQFSGALAESRSAQKISDSHTRH